MRTITQTCTTLVVGLMLVAGLSGCGKTTSVERVDSETTIDLTGKWNDSDSRRVAETMVESMLKESWKNDWYSKNDRKPRVIVGQFRNRSSEHIDMETWTKDIERELINAGEVDFVAMDEERSATRAERQDQQQFSTDESAAKQAAELGADYMLSGFMATQNQKVDGQEVRAYQVHMQLINIETQVKAWVGSKKIKKKISRSSFSF